MGQMGRRFSAFGRGEKGKEIKFWMDFGMENIYLGCLVRKKRGRKEKRNDKKKKKVGHTSFYPLNIRRKSKWKFFLMQ